MNKILTVQESIEHMRIFYILQCASVLLSCGKDPKCHVDGYNEYLDKKDSK